MHADDNDDYKLLKKRPGTTIGTNEKESGYNSNNYLMVIHRSCFSYWFRLFFVNEKHFMIYENFTCIYFINTFYAIKERVYIIILWNSMPQKKVTLHGLCCHEK